MYICKNNIYIMKMHPILFRLAILAASLLPLVACNGGKSQTNTSDGPVEVLEKYDVKGVELKMVELPGGAFSMGALADGRFVKGAPTQHMVVLNGYAISEQPVSQALLRRFHPVINTPTMAKRILLLLNGLFSSVSCSP